jgi:hypothetical protein
MAEEHGARKNKRTASKDRFSHHACWHHDAWQGLLTMPPEQVGVYWRIILMMYIRRAPLIDCDREMAQLCHTDLRAYRRIKAALIERGRIVIDADNAILFDERTVRELVSSGFYSEAQAKRAKTRHGGATPKRRGNPALKAVDKADSGGGDIPLPGLEPTPKNAAEPAPKLRLNRSQVSDKVATILVTKFAQSCDKVGDKVAAKLCPSLVDNHGPPEQNQTLSRCRRHATHYPIPNIPLSAPVSAASGDAESAAPARPPSPSIGGGRAPRRRGLGEEDLGQRQAALAAARVRACAAFADDLIEEAAP